MPKLAPFRRVLKFDECWDVIKKRRLVRMKLECHHEIYRHDDKAHSGQRQRCADCRDRKKGSRAISKAALASWGL